MSVFKEPKKRRPKDCIFHMSELARRNDTACKLTTYLVCDPASCPWFETEEELRASYERAAKIWEKARGRNDYYARGLAPLLKGGLAND